MKLIPVVRDHKNCVVIECYSGFKGEEIFMEFELKPPEDIDTIHTIAILQALMKFGYGVLVKDNINKALTKEAYTKIIGSMPLTRSGNDSKFKIFKYRFVEYNDSGWKRNMKMDIDAQEEAFIKNEHAFILGQISYQRYLVVLEELGYKISKES